ncbi:MAG: TonB-dependent receptor [Acidimicrobiia bacterium]|nr:TonB-dependent receptor [Acidimicrobiia bacterium]
MTRLGLLMGIAAWMWAQPARRDVVVVTGQYEPVPMEEAERQVHAVPIDKQRRLLSNTVTDFLNLDSSIDLRQRGQNNMQTDVSIRGGTFGQTLVLLDGMRLNDVQSGHHNMDLPLPVESMDRVEVLKGSGSTLYGSDAIGGVIHFITKAPEVSELRVRTGIGNFGVNQQRATASLLRGKWSQQLAFSRDFSSGFIANRDYRNLAGTSTTRLTSELGTTTVLLGHADKPFGAEQYYGRFNSWERTKTWFASINQNLGQRTNAAFAFRRHTDLFVLYRDRPQVFTNRHAVESYQGSFRRAEPVGQNAKLHWGLEGLHDAIVSNNLGTHSRARGAGYVALDVRALQRFSFSLGAREELYGSGESQFSPTAAAGVWVNSHLKFRGSISRAFRLPSFTDLYYHDPANVGSPDLRPESAVNYEAGFDWNAGGNLKGEFTVFHRRERDGIDFVRRAPTDLWRATNFQSLRFTGVEAGVTARVERTHLLHFKYTGLHGAQNLLTGVQSRYTFNYPSHLGVAGWESALPGSVVARARLGAVQRFARDPYAVMDVYVARTRGRVNPFVQLTNLTDTVYQEIFGVVMPGRAAVVGVEIGLFGAK